MIGSAENPSAYAPMAFSRLVNFSPLSCNHAKVKVKAREFLICSCKEHYEQIYYVQRSVMLYIIFIVGAGQQNQVLPLHNFTGRKKSNELTFFHSIKIVFEVPASVF